MKRILILLLLSNSILFSITTPEVPAIVQKIFSHEILAKVWIEEYFKSASHEDLQLTANLIYFSYLRSIKILEAQDIALGHLNISWNYWQNIVQTRVDPTVPLPHPSLSDKSTAAKSGQDLEEAFKSYMIAGKTYTNTVNSVVKENIIKDADAQTGIKRLRAGVRVIVVKSILSCWQEVLHFIKQAIGKSVKNLEDLDLELEHNLTPDEVRSIFSYAPQLAVYMFSQSDKEYSLLSEKCWQAFFTTQDMSITLWKTIETDRSALYKAYYEALYNYMQMKNTPASFMTQAFDENGIIDLNNRNIALPIPEMLI